MRHPFSLEDEAAYRDWRDAKLAAYPRTVSDLVVDVRDPRALRGDERERIADRIQRANMALLQCTTGGPIN